ncbi:MAG: zinc-binding alcohol dehydrogenase [Chloroflexota bacterium]|nr:zinc-binding alcohol dehydrogenase [Chloroflexota bacterium]MDE2920810.1 zinc-binding alcohol dehydrogenase [Chloroflexota bacterium]
MPTIDVPRVAFVGSGRVEIDSVAVSDPLPNQIRVRTTQSLISAGSERNSFELAGAEGRRPGYSSVGVVDAVGREVAGYREGDRVYATAPHQGAHLVEVDRPRVVDRKERYPPPRIPRTVTDVQATFLSLADVALHGVRRGRPYIGDAVAVFGQGVVGQLVTQFARMVNPYPLIGIDLVDERLELARRSGATHTVNASREDGVARVIELTGGEGARVVFMVTRTPSILPDCMRATAAGGTVTLTGSPPGAVEIRLQEELLRKELTITGTYQTRLYPLIAYHMQRWTRPANRAYIYELMGRGGLAVDHLVSHHVPYTHAQEMYAMIARGPVGWTGIVLDWSEA